MPNFPPNYKEQESYYSSQEYKDNATMALEQGNKLPTLEDKKQVKVILQEDCIKNCHL